MNNECFKELGLTQISPLNVSPTGQKNVYEAISDKYGRVVLKVVKPDQNLERITREIEIAKKCQGFDTSTIYLDGVVECESQEYFYIVESFIDGETIRAYLARHGTLDYAEVCNFVRSLLNAIQILEKEGLVHRDIKPDNIIRGHDGRYFLIDFGIARDLNKESITSTGDKFGPATFAYAPIEQIENKKELIDSRTDLYSICLVAYEMLMGKHPYVENGDGPLQIIRKVDKGEFDLLPNKQYTEINDFIHTCMNKFITRRPESAQEAFSWFQDISKQCK